MRSFDKFSEALDKFRLSGGAMIFSPAHFSHESDTWFIGTVDEIAEMSDHPVRECTEHALFAGGMMLDDIDKELSDWRE